MVAPPSRDELLKRLRGRGTESEDKILSRVKRMDYELSKEDVYDYVVVNDVLDKCVERIEDIIVKEKETRHD